MNFAGAIDEIAEFAQIFFLHGKKINFFNLSEFGNFKWGQVLLNECSGFNH